MIPKIIHYCWFGGAKKSKLIQKCMQSWHKFCPDYEIKEWNETNFDIHCCKYVEEAYVAKKWAFVSDYCRFYALNKFGGVYLDTDVELLKDLRSLMSSAFMGFESPKRLNPGLICGCEKKDIHCNNLLEEYNNDVFVVSDGEYNLRTVCDRATDEFIKYGLKLDNSTQRIDNYTIFSQEYFNPCDFEKTGKIEITDNTISIHHYSGSWVDKKSKRRGNIYKLLCRLFGVKFADNVRNKFGKKKS